jgi:hypothetical protein
VNNARRGMLGDSGTIRSSRFAFELSLESCAGAAAVAWANIFGHAMGLSEM